MTHLRQDIRTITSDHSAVTDPVVKDSLRRCLVTGDQLPKHKLLRFVVGPADELVFDVTERLPGRGLWLRAERDMITAAVSKRLFAKAARQNVVVPDDLAQSVVAGLKRRCLDRLGLARRAGLVAMGYEQVRARVKAGDVSLLVEAADGAEDGRRKVKGGMPGIPVLDVLSSAELGEALGRDHVVHVALRDGKLTSTLHSDGERLRSVLTDPKENED